MDDKVYYDTCIFMVQNNCSHPEQASCNALCDMAKIKWRVVYGEWSRYESSIGELLDNFEIQAALNGVSVFQVPRDAPNGIARNFHALKRALAQLGLKSGDWRHLMAATWAEAGLFLTTDRDFWNPQAKSQKGSHPVNGPVRSRIHRDLSIRIELPSRWIEELGASSAR